MSFSAVLGIDVSKDTLACNLVHAQTHRSLRELSVPRTAAGVTKLLAQIPADVPWVMEPTGRYSLEVAKLALAAGRTVLMADPKAAHHYLKSLSPRAKTDKIDSRGLALLALDRKLKPYPVKAAPLEKVDQLLAARRGISEALSRLKQQARELPYAADPLQQAIADLQKQQKELDRQLEAAAKQEPLLATVKELRRVPGIGLLTAVTAVSRLAARAFAHPDAFVAFMGCDIRIVESGKRRGELGLSKHGDAEMRRLFFLAAKSSVRAKESPFTAQYEREQRKGLKKTAALCAVARKIARLVWSLYQHQSRYDPARVYQAAACPAA
jgi:transposase